MCESTKHNGLVTSCLTCLITLFEKQFFNLCCLILDLVDPKNFSDDDEVAEEVISIVDPKSNSALLYNNGHNFWKSVLTQKIPQNRMFPY